MCDHKLTTTTATSTGSTRSVSQLRAFWEHLVSTTSRAFSRAFALATAVVDAALRWSASCLFDHHTFATATAATDAAVSTSSVLETAESDDTTTSTKTYDHATPKICVLLFSSECGDRLQRASVNRTRDLLHDLDLHFVQMDVATTIDMHDKLMQRDLQEVSKTRTFPQVFTVEMGVDKPMTDRICYIPEWLLQKAEFYMGAPVTELARLSVLDFSAHRLFAGVSKRKGPNAFAEQVLALPSGLLIAHPTRAAPHKQ